ncbi:MAG: four helix bundle protein [Planctomycetota bacterium]|nr:four helix bundle protein [Planctomycetota bacterium]
MSYRDLEIWQMARDLSVRIHKMTLEKLPKFEAYEEGAQIRRSSKSVRSNIVEGYGRRRYKQDFIRFIVTAEASCDETTDHLETLYETHSLTDQALYEDLHEKLRTLARKINQFLSAVEVQHQSVKEETPEYGLADER